MRRSFVRLVVGSVLAAWALGFVVLVIYARSQTWTSEDARRDGVFLVHQLLEAVPSGDREARLRELQPHFRVGFALMDQAEVDAQLGAAAREGVLVNQPVSVRKHGYREQWYFVPFTDGHDMLAAGPVQPAIPPGRVPIGLLLAVLGLPAIAGTVVLRVERSIRRVERASAAFALGELGTRVDDRNELADRFNAMAERVERLVRTRDELVQAVSHELGSPLSRLRFHLELLDGATGARRADRVDRMIRELDALDELVGELLGYVQSDDAALERDEFDPNRGLADLAELARLEVSDDRAVDVELASPEGVLVFADRRLFERAVENVLRNAVRYAASRVVLEVERDELHVRVTVHDDGPGIPEDLRDDVTRPFFRLEPDRGRSTGGVGLGLAIVSRIVQRHGGRLVIDASWLGGAAVTTSWPARGLGPA